jgi:hypothetical protein
MTRVFALTTRGLEAVSADEMGAVPGVQVKEAAYRRVAATCEAPLALLLGLRTVDDVFLDVGTWSGITRQRSTLTRLGKLSAKLGLHEAVAHCAEFRPIPRSPAFSITANFVGKRNYSTDDIKQACAEGTVQCTGWTYVPDDAEADLNVRVFIEHERAFVGLRLGEAPLHRRFYKQACAWFPQTLCGRRSPRLGRGASRHACTRPLLRGWDDSDRGGVGWGLGAGRRSRPRCCCGRTGQCGRCGRRHRAPGMGCTGTTA